MAIAVERQLVKHIGEAYAMEKTVMRMLDGMISRADDPDLRAQLVRHREETEQHAERLERRLEAHGESTPLAKEAGGMLGALMKGVLDAVRGDQPGRDARDGYVTEHMEIAAYELLERVARHAGDTDTAQVALENRGDEERMAQVIAGNWDKIAAMSIGD